MPVATCQLSRLSSGSELLNASRQSTLWAALRWSRATVGPKSAGCHCLCIACAAVYPWVNAEPMLRCWFQAGLHIGSAWPKAQVQAGLRISTTALCLILRNHIQRSNECGSHRQFQFCIMTQWYLYSLYFNSFWTAMSPQGERIANSVASHEPRMGWGEELVQSRMGCHMPRYVSTAQDSSAVWSQLEPVLELPPLISTGYWVSIWHVASPWTDQGDFNTEFAENPPEESLGSHHGRIRSFVMECKHSARTVQLHLRTSWYIMGTQQQRAIELDVATSQFILQ